MTQIRDTTEKGLKARMSARIDQLGWTLARVAEATGDSYKNVQRWVRGTTSPPADFVARYVAAVPVNPIWLLTNEGAPDPVQASEIERAFLEIARIVDEARKQTGPGGDSPEPGESEPTEPEAPAPRGVVDGQLRHVEDERRRGRREAG